MTALDARRATLVASVTMPKLTGFAPVPIRGPAPLPLAGSRLNILRFLADPVGRMLALHRAFGRIAAVTDGDPGLVCAFGAELNREVLSNAAAFKNNEEFFFEAPPNSSFSRFNASLVLMNGERHKRARRLMMPAFQKSAIDGYAPAIVACASEMLDRWPVGQTADVAALVRELTLVVAVRCFFGVDVKDGAEELGRIAVEQLDALASPSTMVFPFDLPGTRYRRLLEVCEILEARFRALLADKRSRPADTRDVLAILVNARDEDGSALSDDELVGHMNTLFVAGHETTANTLAWTLFLLAQHPEIHASTVDEVTSTLRGGAPGVENVPRMPLVDRVVRESMRILPATPMLFMRVATSPVSLGPYRLPVEANVILSPLVTHRDPDRYPDPARFVPARWEKLEPTAYEYLPFGTGSRMCLGAGFATLALRLILPMILQRFRLTLAHGADVSRAVRGITFGPKNGMPMLIAPQDRRFSRRDEVRGDIHELCEL
jgi:cytochrome P450